jgi:flagellar motor switch protein FliN
MIGEQTNLGMLLDVPVTLTVELGSCQMSMKEILHLDVGSLIELDTLADAPVDVLINHKRIAKGEIVVLEDKIGIRIIEINGVKLQRPDPVGHEAESKESSEVSSQRSKPRKDQPSQ